MSIFLFFTFQKLINKIFSMLTNKQNTMERKGYLYVRSHPSYDVDGVCKLGRATDLYRRDAQYATSELHRGFFKVVLAVPAANMEMIERLLKTEFRHLNRRYDGGLSFTIRKLLLSPSLV